MVGPQVAVALRRRGGAEAAHAAPAPDALLRRLAGDLAAEAVHAGPEHAVGVRAARDEAVAVVVVLVALPAGVAACEVADTLAVAG